MMINTNIGLVCNTCRRLVQEGLVEDFALDNLQWESRQPDNVGLKTLQKFITFSLWKVFIVWFTFTDIRALKSLCFRKVWHFILLVPAAVCLPRKILACMRRHQPVRPKVFYGDKFYFFASPAVASSREKVFCIICWLVFVPSQSIGPSANQSPRSSHAECTCKIQIHIEISLNDYNLAQFTKLGKSQIRTTNRSWSREMSFCHSVEFLQGSPSAVGRVEHTWTHCCYRVSKPWHYFTFSDFQRPPSWAWGRWGGCRQWRCEGLWRVGQKWFRRQRRDPSSPICSLQIPPCGENFLVLPLSVALPIFFCLLKVSEITVSIGKCLARIGKLWKCTNASKSVS